jgi:hypothetical protein
MVNSKKKCKLCVAQRKLTSYNRCICYGQMYNSNIYLPKNKIEKNKINQNEIENFLNELLNINVINS